jgi:hypothetical protein
LTTSTVEGHDTVEQDLGILSVSGCLGPDAVHRFAGATGWVVGRGSGPVIADLTELRSWSAEGQTAITEGARAFAVAGRGLDLAAIPADGSLVPGGECPTVPVHSDRVGALAAHHTRHGEPAESCHEWHTTGWQAADHAGERPRWVQPGAKAPSPSHTGMTAQVSSSVATATSAAKPVAASSRPEVLAATAWVRSAVPS